MAQTPMVVHKQATSTYFWFLPKSISVLTTAPGVGQSSLSIWDRSLLMEGRSHNRLLVWAHGFSWRWFPSALPFLKNVSIIQHVSFSKNLKSGVELSLYKVNHLFYVGQLSVECRRIRKRVSLGMAGWERTLEEGELGSLISSWRATPQNGPLSRRIYPPELTHRAEMCPQSPSKLSLKQAPASSPLTAASPFRWKPSIWGLEAFCCLQLSSQLLTGGRSEGSSL